MLWATFHIRPTTGNNPMMVPGLPKIAEMRRITTSTITALTLSVSLVSFTLGVRHTVIESFGRFIYANLAVDPCILVRDVRFQHA